MRCGSCTCMCSSRESHRCSKSCRCKLQTNQPVLLPCRHSSLYISTQHKTLTHCSSLTPVYASLPICSVCLCVSVSVSVCLCLSLSVSDSPSLSLSLPNAHILFLLSNLVSIKRHSHQVLRVRAGIHTCITRIHHTVQHLSLIHI